MSIRIERILVPVDFSDHSRAALRYAVFMARSLNASLEVLNVYDPPFSNDDIHIKMPDGVDLTVQQYVLRQTEEQMERMLGAIACVDELEISEKIMAGVPDEVIIDRAAEGRFDMVVMGTHGRRGLARVLMGSVAERVTRSARCPVLVVRGFEDGLEDE